MNEPLDAAWKELEADALASDGPIRDSDVKDAIRRQRPHIEAAARADYAGIIGIIDDAKARGLALHVATRATCAEHIEHGDDKVLAAWNEQ